jgi:hypothetical protein
MTFKYYRRTGKKTGRIKLISTVGSLHIVGGVRKIRGNPLTREFGTSTQELRRVRRQRISESLYSPQKS